MRTSALFGVKSMIEIYDVSRRKGIKPVRTFCRQRERGGQFFSILWMTPICMFIDALI